MKHIILFIFISLVLVNAKAQSVGIGTTTPNNSSILEISSNNKGVLLPRLSDTSSVSSPAKGLVIFSNKNNKLWYYDGNHWQQAVSNAGGMDSIWYKVKDSVVFTPQEYVRINTAADLISPKANLEVTGSFLVQQKMEYTQTVPTPSQLYTMNNSGSLQNIPSVDSVLRLYDPSGPNNFYTGAMQGNVIINTGAAHVDGFRISSVAADFGFGTGDTLWISEVSYPSCRTNYFRFFTNSTMNPADFMLPIEVKYFIFRSDADGNNGKGFNFLITKLYNNDPQETMRPIGSGLCYTPKANSFAVGYNAQAGVNATALGYYAEATGGIFASGTQAKAIGSGSVALGEHAVANGFQSSALTAYSRADGDYSIAIGGEADGQYSVALGSGSYASGQHALAFGEGSNASGDNSIAFTSGDAPGNYSIAFGPSQATGTLSVSAGQGTISRSYSGTSLGMYNNPILFSPATTSTAGQPMFIVGNGNSSSDRSNAMVVIKNGNVGLGTDFPSERLEIEGNVIMNNAAGGTTMALHSAGVQKGFVQLSGNNLRLGTYSDNDAGTVVFRLNGADRFTINPNGNATLTGTLTQNSDAKFKDGIQQIDSALNKLMQVNGYRYHWKPELKRDSSTQLGLIAQNVESVFPELVSTNKEGDKSVAYQNMVAVLIEAIKEQQKLIAGLKNEMTEMKKLVEQK